MPVALIIAILQIVGVCLPYAIEGIKALIAAIEAHGDPSKLTLGEVEHMAEAHGVDLKHVIAAAHNISTPDTPDYFRNF